MMKFNAGEMNCCILLKNSEQIRRGSKGHRKGAKSGGGWKKQKKVTGRGGVDSVPSKIFVSA